MPFHEFRHYLLRLHVREEMAGCGAYTKIDGFAILPVMSYSMASSGLWTAPLAMRIALCSVDRSPLSVGAAGDDLYLFLCGPRAGSLYGGVTP